VFQVCLTELTINSRVEDKSVRYVAEENIEPVGPRMAELPKMLVAIAGKHFKRWDEETRVFVSNIRDEYPED
jgi:F-box protein 21